MGDINTNDLVIQRSELGLPHPYKEPINEVEKSIAEIWQIVMNIDMVGSKDDFFEIGGDSLVATVLASQLEGHFGCKFSPSNIIEYSTVAAQAAYIRPQQENRINIKNNIPPYLNLFNAAGTKSPLFVIHGASGFTMYGKGFIDGFSSDQPIGFLEAPGLDGKGPQLGSFEEFAERYLDAIRQVAPGGNWQIVANCLGGLIAIEMCLQAVEHGEHVSRLILIDPPNLREKRWKRWKKSLRTHVRNSMRIVGVKFCQFLPIDLARRFFIMKSGSPEVAVSDEYDEKAAFEASIEARAKRQKDLEERFHRRIKGAVPSRMNYNAESMRQVSQNLHKAFFEYELRNWNGAAFILACRDRSTNLGFWRSYLPNVECRSELKYDHHTLFTDGLPDMLDFIHKAIAPDSEEHSLA